jgi:hypothetical protein
LLIWAYKRKGILGFIAVFLFPLLGALIIALIPPDDKDKK